MEGLWMDGWLVGWWEVRERGGEWVSGWLDGWMDG